VRKDSAREFRLFRRHARFGDPAARDELLRRFMPLARRLARRYRRGNEPLDDLMQVASLGLLKAIDRFDPERGTEFSTFAVPTILGELKRYFRDYGWVIEILRPEKERVLEVERTVENLSPRLGRSPTPGEIAAATSLSVEEVLDALALSAAARPASLDAAVRVEDGQSKRLSECFGYDDRGLELVECRDAVSRSLRGLTAREHEVLYLRFVEDLTQAEIGARIGVSQMHVSRLLRRALEHSRALAEGSERLAAARRNQPKGARP
jgi:RNA polymerase sigma-B factor